MSNSRGILMIAHNNSEIDYFKIACANALMAKSNLGVPVTLVTDEGTLNWGKKSLGDDLINQCFENVIFTDRNWNFLNPRTFSDTAYSSKTLEFYNCNHWQAYELSPYDETLFIDADYLIMSDSLSRCWGSPHDFMIDDRIYSDAESQPHVKLIDDFGISLYWATVIYFKKTEFSQHMFNIVRHVQENYQYYRDLYSFSSSMFRNDNAFSVAVHTMQGFSKNRFTELGRLPIPGLLMSWDTSDIHDIPNKNEIHIIFNKDNSHSMINIKDTDVHIMNKWAINRFSDKLISLYGEDNV